MKPTNEVIQSLKQAAKENNTFNAVAHVFALRKRTRSQLTITSLYHKMYKEGFKFEPAEYSSVLQILSNLGFGRLEKNHKGKIVALKDIKVTLQSIGAAAIGYENQIKTFTGFSSRNRFSPLPKTQEIRHAVSIPVKLTVVINGKSLAVSIPDDMTPSDIAEVIHRLKDKAAA